MSCLLDGEAYATNWKTLFRDPTTDASIRSTFVLSDAECRFLIEHAHDIALAIALARSDRRLSNSTVTGDPPIIPPETGAAQEQRLQQEAEQMARVLTDALTRSAEFTAEVSLTSEPRIEVHPSPVAEATFTCFRPDSLGEVEFHSSRRFYVREAVENIRLRVTSRTEERRNRFLYDLENKYKNIKTQLGEEYVAAVLRGIPPAEAPLQSSIKELFRTFFPGKTFLGVRLARDNSLSFPVELDTGEQHDIDELSSGEKEIVYGYLWLRTGTPRNSVILVDEPELHLNPALVQGLPAFYQVHLADALDAQVWIVTHSDAILRQGVRAPNMTVFHMARPLPDGSQQARKIDSQDAVEAAVLDLVGDLAAYRPYARIVLVEGHRDTRFDVDMIRRLFPDLAERANLIPVGNRAMTTGVRVRLVEVLEEAGLTGRAVSISDGDLGLGVQPEAGHFTWPVYEIENFLLEPSVIRATAKLLLREEPFPSDDSVIRTLRELSEPLVDAVALNEVQYALNKEFLAALSIGASPQDPMTGLLESATASQQRIASADVSEQRIRQMLDESAATFRATLETTEFLSRLPGDRLLRALAGNLGVSGDLFKNACLDQAQRLAMRPKGMEEVLRRAITT